MTTARVITTAVKAIPVKQVGYARLTVPVMEDKVLAQRWAESACKASPRHSWPSKS